MLRVLKKPSQSIISGGKSFSYKPNLAKETIQGTTAKTLSTQLERKATPNGTCHNPQAKLINTIWHSHKTEWYLFNFTYVFHNILPRLIESLCDKCKLRCQRKTQCTLQEVFQVLLFRYCPIMGQCWLGTQAIFSGSLLIKLCHHMGQSNRNRSSPVIETKPIIINPRHIILKRCQSSLLYEITVSISDLSFKCARFTDYPCVVWLCNAYPYFTHF